MNIHSINEPVCLAQDFLNDTELHDIKTKVIELKPFWEYLKNRDADNSAHKMLPGLSHYKLPYYNYESVKKIKSIMWTNFEPLYNKIQCTLENLFEIETYYSKSCHYPGFHIFTNENNNHSVYDIENWHKDIFDITLLGKVGTIFSLNIPITLPKHNACLFYNNRLMLTERQADNYKQFNYKIGSLNAWSGNIMHTMGVPFNLNDTESRITLQFHLNVHDKRACIFW